MFGDISYFISFLLVILAFGLIAYAVFSSFYSYIKMRWLGKKNPPMVRISVTCDDEEIKAFKEKIRKVNAILMGHSICIGCDFTGLPDYPLMSCPKCFGILYCPYGCGHPDEVHGLHYFHWDKCSYHYGPCEEPVWCECIYRREKPDGINN